MGELITIFIPSVVIDRTLDGEVRLFFLFKSYECYEQNGIIVDLFPDCCTEYFSISTPFLSKHNLIIRVFQLFITWLRDVLMSQNPINFSSTSENNVSVYKHLTSYRSFYSDKSIVYKSQRTLRFDLLSLPLPLLISRLGFHNQNFSHVLICIGISFLSISLDLQILNRCGDSILPSIIIFRGPFFGFFIKGFRFH